MSNVKLAVRVRPFTEKELKSEKDRIPVVNVIDEHTVTITNTKVSVSGAGDSRERIRQYYADYTFDSSCPSLPSYASQQKVFEAIGHQVIETVSRGNSACVMAYGQSATGKTHTMMGTDDQPGLVPRLCRSLAQLQPLEITVSFLEIYNERVHDLLAEATPPCHSLPRRRGNARKDLRVREHPLRGPYVQNLRRVAVDDIEALLQLVSEGTRRRRTAATRRNSTSSRSHALLDINTTQGTLHLADLAGSEKASWEGCGGGRQKEGANINKSLVALSNVISALVSGGVGRSKFVPYRDSALTWLLKDCFTGGASTYIIATVSPSLGCYGESASTLRWAERARLLPPVKTGISAVNAVPKGILLDQYNRLLAELAKNFIRYIPDTGLLYDDNHWLLKRDKNISQDVLKSDTKIGSIMDRLYPKPEQNSETVKSSISTGSSELINSLDKNIKIVDEINKEVDKLFAPALERTCSGSDLKVVAPLRHKKRQYRSQEVLPLDEVIINPNRSPVSSLPSPNAAIPQGSEHDKAKITILHDSQRAEIVASVTERLYTKLKKKEEAAVNKMESVVDKKIVEPLSELRICTNARQRLMELSHKALRNKRRIGIPAHTQTRVSVIRVKDQGIDVQSDLEDYILKNEGKKLYTIYRDVSTETMPMTPRYKEIAVGSRYGTLNLSDQATTTEKKKIKNAFTNTDKLIKCSQLTQTPIAPPPRRKKRKSSAKKCLKDNDNLDDSMTSVISINISQTYPLDSETQSSDDNVEKEISNKASTPPDLLKNHCDTNQDASLLHKPIVRAVNSFDPKTNNTPNTYKRVSESKRPNYEFPDSEDCSLPRVSIDPSDHKSVGEMRNMILGRNKNVYPYNIILSPPKERLSKNVVTFMGDEDISTTNLRDTVHGEFDSDMSRNGDKLSDNNVPLQNRNDISSDSRQSDSNSSDSSKIGSNSFIWKQGNSSLGYTRRNYVPVYKSNPKFKTAQAKFYEDFLNGKCDHYCSSTESFGASSDRSSNNNPRHSKSITMNSQYSDIEKKIMRSCNDLDMTATNYENYLKRYRRNSNTRARTPTEYLQHLVKLRKEVVQAGSDTTN